MLQYDILKQGDYMCKTLIIADEKLEGLNLVEYINLLTWFENNHKEIEIDHVSFEDFASDITYENDNIDEKLFNEINSLYIKLCNTFNKHTGLILKLSHSYEHSYVWKYEDIHTTTQAGKHWKELL